jgi:transglutaminase-like putative cysteine protease
MSMVGIALAARINLHDGASFETESLTFDGAVVVTDGDTIPRSEIKEIVFKTKGGQETEAASADADVRELLDKAADATKRFPDAQGILLLDDGKNTLHEDGTRNFSYHMAYIVLSEARKGVATFRRYFREGDNEIKIHFARVIKPSGRVIELNPADIRIETPPRGIVFFGKRKWVTFTLPEVQIGDIVEYSYENIRFNPWNKEIFDAGYFFESDDPFIYSRLTVDVPEDEFIQWKRYNDEENEVKFSQEAARGRMIYTWVAKNMAPYVPEPSSPPEGDFLTRVDVTNQKNWDAIHDWYAGFQNERLKITPELQALADSLTVDAEDAEKRIAAIYYWVQQNIRYISIKGSASSGVSGHPAQFTLDQGFGDCTDKAILFSTMLRAAGIDADPVYVGTNDDVAMLDPALPNYYGNHCITEVFLQDTSFYLDATGSSNGGFSRYPSFNAGDHGVYAVNSQKRKVEIIPVPEPGLQQREYHLDLEIDEEGALTVHYQSFYHGDYETGLRYYWNYVSREEDRRMRFEQMVKSVSPDAELISYELINVEDLSKQLSLKMSYRVEDYVKFAGPVAIINLPEIGNRLTFNELSIETRKYPFSYATSEAIRHTATLKLPPDWKIDYVPGDISLAIPEVSYSATYIQEVGNLIYFEDDFSRPERIIQPERYPKYQKTLNSITSYHKKPILVVLQGGGQ